MYIYTSLPSDCWAYQTAGRCGGFLRIPHFTMETLGLQPGTFKGYPWLPHVWTNFYSAWYWNVGKTKHPWMI